MLTIPELSLLLEVVEREVDSQVSGQPGPFVRFEDEKLFSLITLENRLNELLGRAIEKGG